MIICKRESLINHCGNFPLKRKIILVCCQSKEKKKICYIIDIVYPTKDVCISKKKGRKCSPHPWLSLVCSSNVVNNKMKDLHQNVYKTKQEQELSVKCSVCMWWDLWIIPFCISLKWIIFYLIHIRKYIKITHSWTILGLGYIELTAAYVRIRWTTKLKKCVRNFISCHFWQKTRFFSFC